MFAQLTSFTILHSWLSIQHCPHTLQIHVVSKSGDNIGLVWRKMYMSEQCQFEMCSHHPLYYCITYTLSCLLVFSPIFTIYYKTFKHHCIARSVQHFLFVLIVLFNHHCIARSVLNPVICGTVVLEVCKPLNRLSPYISMAYL